MTEAAWAAVLTSGVVMMVPLLLAGLGELFVERSGVINVGLEGMMLVGALACLAYGLVPVAALALFHTRWGLKLRATGENPAAADTMGVNVPLLRWQALLIGGALAGLGGVFLSIGHIRSFSEEMIAGRGFI